MHFLLGLGQIKILIKNVLKVSLVNKFIYVVRNITGQSD